MAAAIWRGGCIGPLTKSDVLVVGFDTGTIWLDKTGMTTMVVLQSRR